VIDVLVETGFVEVTRPIFPRTQRIKRSLLPQRRTRNYRHICQLLGCVKQRIDCDLTFRMTLPGAIALGGLESVLLGFLRTRRVPVRHNFKRYPV
jgi:hypothetical protein